MFPARPKELCPGSVDIFFDNVGGAILDAALARLVMPGRVVLCGGIGALASWVRAGKIKTKVDVQHGLENAPATLRRLFEGRNDGKQLLRIAE